jgi:hypothetical protein
MHAPTGSVVRGALAPFPVADGLARPAQRGCDVILGEPTHSRAAAMPGPSSAAAHGMPACAISSQVGDDGRNATFAPPAGQ